MTDTADESPRGQSSVKAPQTDETAPLIDRPEPDKRDEPAVEDLRRGERSLLLVIAVIAAVTGIVGAGVGGYFATGAAATHTRTAAVLAERQERKDAYSLYFTSLDDLNDIVYDLGNLVRVYKPADNEHILAKIAERDNAWNEWARLDDAMLLISSPEVEKASHKVNDAEYVIHGLIDTFQTSMREGKPDEILNRMPEYDRGYEAAHNTEGAFFEAARNDLAGLGYGG
jgi:hypothetical protein